MKAPMLAALTLNALAQLGHFPPPGMIPEETPDVE